MLTNNRQKLSETVRRGKQLQPQASFRSLCREISSNQIFGMASQKTAQSVRVSGNRRRAYTNCRYGFAHTCCQKMPSTELRSPHMYGEHSDFRRTPPRKLHRPALLHFLQAEGKFRPMSLPCALAKASTSPQKRSAAKRGSLGLSRGKPARTNRNLRRVRDLPLGTKIPRRRRKNQCNASGRPARKPRNRSTPSLF